MVGIFMRQCHQKRIGIQVPIDADAGRHQAQFGLRRPIIAQLTVARPRYFQLQLTGTKPFQKHRQRCRRHIGPQSTLKYRPKILHSSNIPQNADGFCLVFWIFWAGNGLSELVLGPGRGSSGTKVAPKVALWRAHCLPPRACGLAPSIPPAGPQQFSQPCFVKKFQPCQQHFLE